MLAVSAALPNQQGTCPLNVGDFDFGRRGETPSEAAKVVRKPERRKYCAYPQCSVEK